MIRATINSLSDKKVILHIEPADAAIKLETEVYFIKAPIKSYLNNYYFDFSATVIQQKRRREPRYQILKKWSQAEVTCEALVRFCSSRDGQGPIAGLEFVQLRPVQQEKISSIVEDLIQHTVMTKV